MPIFRPLIIDATLRERGSDLSHTHRVLAAKSLDELGVDVIDLGTPATAAEASAAARAAAVLSCAEPAVTTPAASLEDMPAVEFAANGFAAAGISRFRIRLAFGETLDDKVISGMIRAAKARCGFVEAVFGEAFRADQEQLVNALRAAREAGADAATLIDGSGCTLPEDIAERIRAVRKILKDFPVGIQARNALGLAVAGTLAAVKAGAAHIVLTMNGLGSGAGCAALEETVTALRVHADAFPGSVPEIQHARLGRTARTVAKLLHEPLARHKPVVGVNAFAPVEGSGPAVFTAESVGCLEQNIQLTSRSGQHMLKASLVRLGIDPASLDFNDLYERFMQLADKKGTVTEHDLEALLFFGRFEDDDPTYILDTFNVTCGSVGVLPTASVRIRVGKRTRTESSTGNGPVDALFNCLMRLTGIRCRLVDYAISANGTGVDALGQVDVSIELEGAVHHGMGLSTDIIEASALAFLHAMNNYERAKRLGNNPLKTSSDGETVRLAKKTRNKRNMRK